MRSFLTTLLIPALACAQAERHAVVTDASGTRTVQEVGPSVVPPRDGFTPRAGIIWQVSDPISITNSVAVSTTTDETWVAHNLNTERLEHYQTTGSGAFNWEFDLLPEEPTHVAVACADDTSLGALLVRGLGENNQVSVRAFSGTGGPPLWTYNFPASFTDAGHNNIDVSSDGSIVVAVAYDPFAVSSRITALDGATGNVINFHNLNAFCTGVDVSADGNRMIVTQGPNGYVYDTTFFLHHFFSVSGAGGFHRISGDGKTVVAGGFNLKVWSDYGHGLWQEDYSATESSHWFGHGVALSHDGGTLFSVSHRYTDYQQLIYRVIDVETGVESGRITTLGAGTLQNSVRLAQASDSGDVLAVCSWGAENNAHPEVQVFDRALNLIGSVDTPGSPFHIDLSRDGRYLAVGSKSVHANVFGNGSVTYAYEVEGQCVADWNGDGINNTTDLLDYLNDYNAVRGGGVWTFGDPDLSAPIGVLNTADLLAFLNAFNAGC